MVLSTGSFSRDIGAKPHLDAFFDTVGCRLEPAGRATRFPAIMADLFGGVLTAERAPAALAELSEIERGLRALPPAKVLGRAIVLRGASAYECLASSDGRPLLEHIRAAVQESARTGSFLEVSVSQGNRAQFQTALMTALFGVAWVVIGRKFFGNWILVSIGQNRQDHSGLYIWSLGYLFMGSSAAVALTTFFPLLRVWFQRRIWATLIVVLALIAGWIYLGYSPR